MDSELLYTIKKALEYYDSMNQNFLKRHSDKGKKSAMNNLIQFGKETYEYEFLAIFDKNTNVWVWGYALPILSDELKQQIEGLHLYGLKQKTIPIQRVKSSGNFDQLASNISILNLYIKTIFGNSRLYINNDLEIDILLAMSSYLLKERIKFIYKDEEDSSLITYYLVK